MARAKALSDSTEEDAAGSGGLGFKDACFKGAWRSGDEGGRATRATCQSPYHDIGARDGSSSGLNALAAVDFHQDGDSHLHSPTK